MYYAAFHEGSDEPGFRHRPVLHVFADVCERDTFANDSINHLAVAGDFATAITEFEALTMVFDHVELHF